MIENAKNNSPPRGTWRIGGSSLSKTELFLRVPGVLRGGELDSATRRIALVSNIALPLTNRVAVA
jgi:hypothetical protein